MAPVEKIGAVPRNVYNPVDAVKLYEMTNRHIAAASSENPFKHTISGLGLFQYGEAGQPNGGTKPEYFEDGTVYEPKTLCWA